MPIDHFLLKEARKLVTGANVHVMKTVIYCYESTNPDSPARQNYEQLLRDSVTSCCCRV